MPSQQLKEEADKRASLSALIEKDNKELDRLAKKTKPVQNHNDASPTDRWTNQVKQPLTTIRPDSATIDNPDEATAPRARAPATIAK